MYKLNHGGQNHVHFMRHVVHGLRCPTADMFYMLSMDRLSMEPCPWNVLSMANFTMFHFFMGVCPMDMRDHVTMVHGKSVYHYGGV